MPKLSISQSLTLAEATLQNTENPQQCALILMAHVLNRSKTWLIANDTDWLSSDEQEIYFSYINRLAKGEPLPYIVEKQSFYGLSFKVNPDVLIPRPETELLVDQALSWLGANPTVTHGLDVGTGSGCIAISLLKNQPQLYMTALDNSEKALSVANENAKIHQVQSRMQTLHSDLLQSFNGQTALICANLPYIPSHTLKSLKVSEFEPKQALDGGEDGLALIRRLLDQSQTVLTKPGLILLEIETTTGDLAMNLAKQHYPNASISLIKDYASKDRLVRIEVIS